MPINILMPALSPTMEKGNLAKWLKKEGDKVKSGDVIAEIETDKATMEVEAVDEGTIAKILVPEGAQDVAVNDVIAVLAGDGEDVKAAGAGAASAPPKAAPPAAKPAPTPAPAAAPATPATAAPAPQPAAASAPQANGHARIFSSPLARRLAKDAGIELGRIDGSGPHGRVIARDVEEAKSGKGLKAPAAAPSAAPAIAPSMSDKQVRALFEDGSYEVIPHDGMRRTIAQRLTASVQTVPHFYLTMDCDIGKLLAAREEINTAAPKDKEKKPLYKLSVNDFVIKALAVALQRIPNCNVSWTDGGMLKHKHSDVGVAVAMPGFQPRHVRHQSFHRCHQPAARHHPRGRHQRRACGREKRQDRSGAHDERHAVLRSPRDRRRARRRTDRRLQDADRKPRHDDGVRRMSRPSLRAQRSNPFPQRQRWIASSQGLLAMTAMDR